MKLFKPLFMVAALTINLFIYADVPEPFESIRNLPATPYYVQDAYTYYSEISTRQSKVIIDVESQDGGVARYIAQQANNLPSVTKIYAINTWKDCGSQKHVFQHFLSNVKQENTTNLIIPIRMSSQEAALSLNITADFISLVGGNDADGIYRDILYWYPHLANGGILCGNNWNEGFVAQGVARAAAALELTLKTNNNVWYFEKSSP